MKHLRRFNEAIVDWESDNLKAFYEEAKKSLKKDSISFEELVAIGNKNDIEIVNYDTFYSELPNDKMRNDAPPKQIPFFGLCNQVTGKLRLVVQVPKIDSRGLAFAYHMMKHENIHVDQKRRKKSKDAPGEYLGDIGDTKAYFSNKDEIMAFAQSVSDMVMDQKPKTLEDAIKMIDRTPLWRPIQSVDDKTKKKYKKYIYLYLEKEFEKLGKGKEIPTSHFLINQKKK